MDVLRCGSALEYLEVVGSNPASSQLKYFTYYGLDSGICFYDFGIHLIINFYDCGITLGFRYFGIR